MSTTPLLDQLKEVLSSDKTATVFIESFLGLITEKRQMFLKHLVLKLQFEDLYLVLQKAKQRIYEPNNRTGDNATKLEQTLESEELDSSVCIKMEDEEYGEHEDIIIKVDPDPLSTALKLDIHMRKHTGITEFKCDECAKTFNTASKLKLHMRKHRGISYACEQCDLIAATKGSLKVHVKSAHEGVCYPCDKCDYKAVHKSSLKVHQDSVHDGIFYSCEHCDYNTTSKGNLKVHVKSVHQRISVTCDKCGKKFSSKTNLWKHNKSIHEGVLYPCEYCDYKSKEKGSVRKHILKQH